MTYFFRWLRTFLNSGSFWTATSNISTRILLSFSCDRPCLVLRHHGLKLWCNGSVIDLCCNRPDLNLYYNDRTFALCLDRPAPDLGHARSAHSIHRPQQAGATGRNLTSAAMACPSTYTSTCIGLLFIAMDLSSTSAATARLLPSSRAPRRSRRRRRCSPFFPFQSPTLSLIKPGLCLTSAVITPPSTSTTIDQSSTAEILANPYRKWLPLPINLISCGFRQSRDSQLAQHVFNPSIPVPSTVPDSAQVLVHKCTHDYFCIISDIWR